jgi:hypothetical protein
VLVAATTGARADGRPGAAAPAAARDGTQDVVFLGDGRPVFIRLRLDTGAKGFRAAWLDAVKSLHAYSTATATAP